ncbi:MAG: DUF58 domain-containing protein [Deltaproteobacteria bacterium]
MPAARPPGRAPTLFGRRMQSPRRLRVTREGKIFIGVTLGVGLAAINTGNNLLYLVLGLLLSLIVLSGILSEIALRGLEFRRRLPRRAFADIPMSVEIEVRNTKKYAPSYSIEVEDRLVNRRTDKRCYFLKVSAGARQTAQYRRTPPLRGAEKYIALRVATRFPFGLFEKWREIDLEEEQLVYPAPVRAPRPAVPSHALGDAMSRDGRGAGEIDGVREIRDTEPMRDIHWRKTAALGRLVGRERRRELSQRLQLEVHNRPASDDCGSSARIENELRRVAWIALDALKEGVAVEVRAQDGGAGAPATFRASPSATAADRVLGFLARLPPETRVAGGS